MLDVYQEWRQRQLKEANVLPKGVYIESEVVRAGPKGNFEQDEEDNPKGLVTNFVREFLDGIKATVKDGNTSFNTVTGGSGGTSALGGHGPLSLKIN